MGILTSMAVSSRVDSSDSFTHDRVNPGSASGLLLCTRANSSEQAASSGSAVGSSSGAGRPIGSSTLGSDGKAPSVGTGGATKAFFAMSSMSRSNRLPCSTRGVRHLWSSCMLCIVPLGAFQIGQYIFEGPWPAPPFLLFMPLGSL